jgi:hypothetical protein
MPCGKPKSRERRVEWRRYMNEVEQAARRIANWGRQTIAFAISLRAEDDGLGLDDAAQVRSAGKATEKIAVELWAEALGESSAPSEVIMRFARKVLDWAADHRTETAS